MLSNGFQVHSCYTPGDACQPHILEHYCRRNRTVSWSAVRARNSCTTPALTPAVSRAYLVQPHCPRAASQICNRLVKILTDSVRFPIPRRSHCLSNGVNFQTTTWTRMISWTRCHWQRLMTAGTRHTMTTEAMIVVSPRFLLAMQ